MPRSAPHIAALFPGPVAAFDHRGPANADHLPAEEAVAIVTAAPVRRSEFAAGRFCARAGLACFGLGDRALPAGRDRRPAWPPGVTGSITHTGDYAAAAVAARGDFAALGLDVERLGRVERPLWRLLFGPAELAALDRLAPDAADAAATAMFCAKEAFYKCQYEVTRIWVDFHDIAVTAADGVVRATPLTDRVRLPGMPWPLIGRYGSRDGLVYCAFALPAR